MRREDSTAIMHYVLTLVATGEALNFGRRARSLIQQLMDSRRSVSEKKMQMAESILLHEKVTPPLDDGCRLVLILYITKAVSLRHVNGIRFAFHLLTWASPFELPSK